MQQEVQLVTVPLSLVEERFARLEGMISGLHSAMQAAAPARDCSWLTYSRFLLENQMGRTRFERLVNEGKVLVRDIGANRKLYRWAEGIEA